MACRGLSAGLLLSTGVASSASGAEEAFLSRTFPADPAWQATAGAFAATSPRTSALAANPAAAAAVLWPVLSFSHLQWAGDLSREWGALATPISSRFGVGADVGILHGAPLQGYDEAGNPTGTFSPTEWDAGASLAANLGRGISLGIGGRYLRLEDPTEPLSSLGVSMGLRWADESRAFALAVTDLGEASDPRYAPPQRVRAGFEQHVSSWVSLGLGASRGEETQVSIGAELRPTHWVALLGGLESRSGETADGFGWSTGLAVERSGLRLGYAFVFDETLGDRHQLGIDLPLRSGSGPWGARDGRAHAGGGQTP